MVEIVFREKERGESVEKDGEDVSGVCDWGDESPLHTNTYTYSFFSLHLSRR